MLYDSLNLLIVTRTHPPGNLRDERRLVRKNKKITSVSLILILNAFTIFIQ